MRLRAHVSESGLGVVLVAPIDLIIQRSPLRIRQPDILYLSAERTGVKERAELKGLPALEMSPDLVVEILSPSNTRRDIENKLDDYRSLGVLETWLVSSEAETIEIVQLATDEAATGAVFGVDGVLRSEALGGFSLPIREIFG